jgi:electron transfer flavoprotein beta subunit
MKIAVIYKWAANPQEASVGADGQIDWSRATYSVSGYDHPAIELGRQLADAAGAELIGVSLGDEAAAPMARKSALSRGLDRLYLVPAPAQGAGSTVAGLLLAAAIREIGDVDLVLAGDASIDIGAQLVPAVVAGALGWPAVAQVTAVTVSDGFQVVRNYQGGTQELAFASSAVLSVAPDAVTPRVPGMKEILAAGKKPSEVLTLDQLDSTLPAPTTLLSRTRPDLVARKRKILDGGDPVVAAQAAVTELRAAGAI